MSEPKLYRSLSAASRVPREEVRRLSLEYAPSTPDFPMQVLEFGALEALWIRFHGHDGGFRALPEGLCRLPALKHLYLLDTHLEALPEAIGELQALETLVLRGNRLQSLPDSIGSLRALRLLDLERNRLHTLPETVGLLPMLASLHLKGNPFATLPASLARVPDVQIEARSRALYRDARYRPELDVPVQREARSALAQPVLARTLAQLCERHGLSAYEAVLARHALAALRFDLDAPDDGCTLGRTRFGGAPDLPPDIAHPATDGRCWLFCAQLDLEALAPLQPWLPRTGHLYFFLESLDGLRARVIHGTAPVGALRRHAYAPDAEFVDRDMDGPFSPWQAQAHAALSLPDPHRAEERVPGADGALLASLEEDEAALRAWEALQQELHPRPPGLRPHQHPRWHFVNAHVPTQRDSPQQQAAEALGGLPEEWVNLLVLDSDRRCGFQFGDAGVLSFCIHEKDLALGDFSRIHLSLEG